MDELEPVRAFAASLREPLEPEGGLEFEQIDEPLPEAEPAESDAADAVRVIKDVARRSRKKQGPVAV
jgi:hypothetical protein